MAGKRAVIGSGIASVTHQMIIKRKSPNTDCIDVASISGSKLTFWAMIDCCADSMNIWNGGSQRIRTKMISPRMNPIDFKEKVALI
jgi:hypothetical protein